MNIQNGVPTDPFGYLEDLRDAFSDPALREIAADGSASPQASLAAYHLALCLGECRLHGVTPADDLPRVLPANLAIAAANQSTELLPGSVEQARQLPAAWDRVAVAAEADALCIGLIKHRNWAWAVDLVTGEAFLRASADGNPVAAMLASAIDRMHAVLDRFDEALAGQIEILSTLCGTNWLANYRASLGPEFRDNLPWWLDGRLEESARRIQAELLRTAPATARAEHGQVCLAPAASAIPAAEPQFALAAKGRRLPIVPGARLTWVSPGGVWSAVLRLPSPLTEAEYAKERSLSFVHCADNSPATDLEGEPVWFGNEPAEPCQIDEEGDILVRLSELRDLDLQRLRVGDPPVDWELQ